MGRAGGAYVEFLVPGGGGGRGATGEPREDDGVRPEDGRGPVPAEERGDGNGSGVGPDQYDTAPGDCIFVPPFVPHRRHLTGAALPRSGRAGPPLGG